MQKYLLRYLYNFLWEYDLSQFDWDEMKVVVTERVVTRGWPKDWKAMLIIMVIPKLGKQ